MRLSLENDLTVSTTNERTKETTYSVVVDELHRDRHSKRVEIPIIRYLKYDFRGLGIYRDTKVTAKVLHLSESAVS